MTSRCTALVLTFALLAMHVVVHHSAPIRRDVHRRAAGLVGTPLHGYRLGKRDDARAVQRAATATHHVDAPHAAVIPVRPAQFADVTTSPRGTRYAPRPLLRVKARGPPPA